jgi:hypothetical protein
LSCPDANLIDLFAAIDRSIALNPQPQRESDISPIDGATVESTGSDKSNSDYSSLATFFEKVVGPSLSRQRSNNASANEQSDIKNLAMILYLLLTGNNFEYLDRLDKDFAERLILSVNKARNDVPQSLVSLIVATLSKDDNAIADFMSDFHACMNEMKIKSV